MTYKTSPFCSVWHSNEPYFFIDQEPLPTKMEAEFVIVGGGFTGLSTALDLALKGKEVIVLEGGKIGLAASGLNGGQLNPGFKHNPTEIINSFGSSIGKKIIEFGANAPKKTMAIIKQHKIECQLEKGGFVQPAHNKASLRIVDNRIKDWKKYTDKVDFLDKNEVGDLLGSDCYIGGFLDRRGATLNPLRLVNGLARAAIKAGVKIYQESLVTRVSFSNGKWHFMLKNSSVQGMAAGIFTNAYTNNLIKPLKQTFIPVQSFQIATEKLSKEITRDLIPNGFGVSDLNRLLVYYRRGPHNRILMGGRGTFRKPKSKGDFVLLERKLTNIFPILKDAKFQYYWFGNVSITPDFMPRLNILGPRAISFLGCNGRGVALSPALGPYLSDWLINGNDHHLPLPVSKKIKTIPFHFLHRLYVASVSSYFKARDWLD